jgi:hypothetical protein
MRPRRRRDGGRCCLCTFRHRAILLVTVTRFTGRSKVAIEVTSFVARATDARIGGRADAARSNPVWHEQARRPWTCPRLLAERRRARSRRSAVDLAVHECDPEALVGADGGARAGLVLELDRRPRAARCRPGRCRHDRPAPRHSLPTGARAQPPWRSPAPRCSPPTSCSSSTVGPAPLAAIARRRRPGARARRPPRVGGGRRSSSSTAGPAVEHEVGGRRRGQRSNSSTRSVASSAGPAEGRRCVRRASTRDRGGGGGAREIDQDCGWRAPYPWSFTTGR